MTIKRALTSLKENIKVKDHLDKTLEDKYMKVLEDMVTGKIQKIGKNEETALIALNREFLRRNKDIVQMLKECKKYNKKVSSLEKEKEELEGRLLLQYEYSQSLLKNYNNL